MSAVDPKSNVVAMTRPPSAASDGAPPGDNERDDAKQVLTVALAFAQQERAAADQLFVRARTAVATAASVFAATQAAFLSSIGRQIGKSLALSKSETWIVAGFGMGAALGLLVAAAALFLLVDKPIKMDTMGPNTIEEAWNAPDVKPDGDTAVALALDAINASRSWVGANETRRGRMKKLIIVVSFTVTCSIAQLFSLFICLAS